jgi:hypothetical protein
VLVYKALALLWATCGTSTMPTSYPSKARVGHLPQFTTALSVEDTEKAPALARGAGQSRRPMETGVRVIQPRVGVAPALAQGKEP